MDHSGPFSASEFLKDLSQLRLLQPGQVEQLEALPSQFLDSSSLTRELVQRGWLSAFQADKILAGQAGQLVLGSYLLLEPLGAGGMGQVFKARHLVMNRLVALKIIRPDLLTRPHVVKRFQREVRGIAQLGLDHPNVVRGLDAAQEGNVHFVVMEYLEGLTLAHWVRDHGPLSLPLACNYLRQAALGLQHLHGLGLIHRDIKPSNLMLLPQTGQVKILDLGLVLSQPDQGDPSTQEELTQPGAMLGTTNYLSPEQAIDAHGVDARTDIFSLGITLFFLLTGQAPWQNREECVQVLESANGPAQILRRLPSGIEADFKAVLARMMARHPGDRYQTAEEVAAALLPWSAVSPLPPTQCASLVMPSTTAEDSPPPSKAPKNGLKVKIVALTLVGAGVLGILAFVAWHNWPADLGVSQPPSPPGKEHVPIPPVQVPPVKVPPAPVKVAAPVEVKRFLGHRDWVSALLFLPDEKHILSGGADGLRLWDRTTGKEVPRFQQPVVAVRCLALSPDSKTLLVGTQKPKDYLSVWDLTSGTRRASFPDHVGIVLGVAFSPDGKHALSMGDTELVLWDMEKLQRVHILPRVRPVNYLALCWAEKNPLTGGMLLKGDKIPLIVQEWGALAGLEVRHFMNGLDLPERLSFSADGCWAVAAQGNLLRKFNVLSGQEVAQNQSEGPVRTLASSPDGKRALYGLEKKIANKQGENEVRFWDWVEEKVLYNLSGHFAPITGLHFSRDGNFALSADQQGTIILWNLRP